MDARGVATTTGKPNALLPEFDIPRGRGRGIRRVGSPVKQRSCSPIPSPRPSRPVNRPKLIPSNSKAGDVVGGQTAGDSREGDAVSRLINVRIIRDDQPASAISLGVLIQSGSDIARRENAALGEPRPRLKRAGRVIDDDILKARALIRGKSNRINGVNKTAGEVPILSSRKSAILSRNRARKEKAKTEGN